MIKSVAMTLLAVSAGLAGGIDARAADLRTSDPVPTYQESDVAAASRSAISSAMSAAAPVTSGIGKDIDCVFHSSIGEERTDHYMGAVRKMGVDLGFTTRSKLIWAVFAPTAGYHQGSLSGLYQGASAEATVGAGVGANILIGGTSGSIHLQTVSVTGQIGLNLAAGGTSVTLAAVN